MAKGKRLKTKGGAAVNNGSSFCFMIFVVLWHKKNSVKFHAVFFIAKEILFAFTSCFFNTSFFTT